MDRDKDRGETTKGQRCSGSSTGRWCQRNEIGSVAATVIDGGIVGRGEGVGGAENDNRRQQSVTATRHEEG